MFRLFPVFFFLISFSSAQTGEIILLNGNKKSFKSIDGSGERIAYRTINSNKLKTVDFERVFSIVYADSTEKVIYSSDPNDSLDFTVEQMRTFILGEQDAIKNYKNHTNKAVAFIIGAGGSYFGGFYGLIPPPLYATIIGSFSPKIEKQKVSNAALINVPAFREGYERKGREFKIRQGMMWGMIGFASGLVANIIISK